MRDRWMAVVDRRDRSRDCLRPPYLCLPAGEAYLSSTLPNTDDRGDESPLRAPANGRSVHLGHTCTTYVAGRMWAREARSNVPYKLKTEEGDCGARSTLEDETGRNPPRRSRAPGAIWTAWTKLVAASPSPGSGSRPIAEWFHTSVH